eukprot:superscaffoldBa00003449_g16965
MPAVLYVTQQSHCSLGGTRTKVRNGKGAKELLQRQVVPMQLQFGLLSPLDQLVGEGVPPRGSGRRNRKAARRGNPNKGLKQCAVHPLDLREVIYWCNCIHRTFSRGSLDHPMHRWIPLILNLATTSPAKISQQHHLALHQGLRPNGLIMIPFLVLSYDL